jgi:hypothetical protein
MICRAARSYHLRSVGAQETDAGRDRPSGIWRAERLNRNATATCTAEIGRIAKGVMSRRGLLAS